MIQRMDSPWGIPVLDLDGETGLQQVLDREAGQYLGHPTSVMIDDGKTILCVYPKGHGAGEILLKKSMDAGRTWSERLPTPKSWETSRETPTIYRMRGQGGEKCLVLFSGLYPVRISRSEDEGQTWSELTPIGDFGGIVAMADMVQLKDGGYMAFFHDDERWFSGEWDKRRPEGKFTVYAVTSYDLGRTWSAPRAILQKSGAHLCEPGVIRTPDGEGLLMLLRENSKRHHSFMAQSFDEGQTWGDLREVSGALTGDRHVLQSLPDGRLFVSFRDTARESPTWGDWMAWIGTYADIVAGRPGQYRLRLKRDYSPNRGDCAYPALELLPSGELLCITYGHWERGEQPYILSLRLDMEALDKAVTT